MFFIGTPHERRLPHSGQYAGAERPCAGHQPHLPQVSTFSAPQPVQKFPSFSVWQAGQLHALPGGVYGSVE